MYNYIIMYNDSNYYVLVSFCDQQINTCKLFVHALCIGNKHLCKIMYRYRDVNIYIVHDYNSLCVCVCVCVNAVLYNYSIHIKMYMYGEVLLRAQMPLCVCV